ncbi:hypothetical protein [Pelagibacterium lacus]|uniref:hypothetical protein n=1 Tax=Pelagibacterium lacus TaxID=2282655 RepID=UPI0011C06DFE|nr:hypothetical protein [Pelagibacterium lacus]
MSAAKPIAVSSGLLGVLNKPIRDPQRYAGYLTGEIATVPATTVPTRLTGPKSGHLYPTMSRFAKRRLQRSPDRERSIHRRRTLAATWPMPPAMAGSLTTSQVAYARIVSDEVKRSGDCRLTLDEIAARGGMCRKTAKRAQDRLTELGWVKVTERPVRGRKHLSNVVAIASAEWMTWIKMGPKPSRRIGGHSCPTTENQSIPLNSSVPLERQKGALERRKWRSPGTLNRTGGSDAV